MRQLLLGKVAFEKSTRVNAGRGVWLEVHQIATVVAIGGAEKMIEADFKQISSRREAGDMATQLAVGTIGAHHHRQRVPAQIGAETLFNIQVARVRCLLLNRNRVRVRRVAQALRFDAALAGESGQSVIDKLRALGAGLTHQRFKAFEPL